MTRKDYELIASVFKARLQNHAETMEASDRSPEEVRYDAGYCHGIENVAERLANMLTATNPRFDKQRFLVACGAR